MEDEPTAKPTVKTKEEPAPTISSVDDDDDAMSYFEKLVEGDEN